MPDEPRSLSDLLAELKRRRVFQVAIVYAVVGFVVIEAADILFPALRLPEWTLTLVVALAILGFPIALVLAWAFEITPEGVRRAAPSPRQASPEAPASAGEETRIPASVRHAALGAGVVIAIGALGFVAWRALSPDPDPEVAAASAGAEGAVDSALAVAEPPFAARPERAVAVLPFDNLGPDTAAGYFTDGMHDAVITTLASVGDLSVTSRTSVMRYTDSDESIREIASALDVTHVVEGTVQRAAERVRVTVQLINGQTDRHIWANSFDRGLTPEALFEIQSEIAREVAGALQARLTPAEERQIERRPTDDLAAYDLYLQAGEIVRREAFSEERVYEVIDLLRRAIELDPEFALAHARLAQAYEELWEEFWRERGEDQWRDSIRVAARRALEIDPDLPEAHIAMADYHQQFGDREAVLRETRRALELRPNYANAIRRLSILEATYGRLDRSLCLARKAVEVEPTDRSLYGRLAAAYRDLGFYAEAERTRRRMHDLRAAQDYEEDVRLSLALGDRRRALEYYRAFRTRMDSSAETLDDLGDIEFELGWIDSALVHYRASEAADTTEIFRAWVYWESGERELAERHLRALTALAQKELEEGSQSSFPHLMLMMVHAIRGAEEQAVEAFASAVDRGWRVYRWFDYLATMKKTRQRLRDNERFREIFRDLKTEADSMRVEAERSGCVR